MIEYDAEARLLNDNLTDLNHLSFVHGQSFAANENYADALPRVTSIERGIGIERWAADQPPLGMPDSDERFDLYVGYDYFVPGILSMVAKVFSHGTLDELGKVTPPENLETAGPTTCSSQSVTPLVPGKTSYHFSQGLLARRTQDMVDFVWQVTLNAFEEDWRMIEGQQKALDLQPDSPILPAVGDKGTLLYNRLIDKLMQQEREDGEASA